MGDAADGVDGATGMECAAMWPPSGVACGASGMPYGVIAARAAASSAASSPKTSAATLAAEISLERNARTSAAIASASDGGHKAAPSQANPAPVWAWCRGVTSRVEDDAVGGGDAAVPEEAAVAAVAARPQHTNGVASI